jgi:hypothetical protein
MSLFGEPAEPSLEARKFAQETAARKRELDLKEREVLAKEEELKRSRWLNPTVIGLFAAALGLIGSVVVARVNNANTQEVQRLQAEANITLEAIKTGTGNTDAACKNLIFFVSLGLIRDPGGKIGTQCRGTPAGPPSLPTGQISSAQTQTFLFKGKVVDGSTKEGIVGAKVSVTPLGALVSTANDYVIFTNENGDFAITLPLWWTTTTNFVRVTKAGYTETTSEVTDPKPDQTVLILLHKAP